MSDLEACRCALLRWHRMGKKTCSIEGCEHPVLARGWCRSHYGRWSRSGDPLETSRSKKAQNRLPCPVEEYGEKCGRPRHTHGLCRMHYERKRRTGSVYNRHRRRGPAELRFWSLVKRDGDNCWPWLGRLDAQGYGHLDLDGRPQLAHRLAWFFTFGTWPPNETLDHECHNRSQCFLGPKCPHRRCCNPAHLIPRSRSENDKARPKRQVVSGE